MNQQTIVTTNNGDTDVRKHYVPVWSKRLPIVKVEYVNGNQVSQCVYNYDTHGNVLSETATNFTSTNTKKTSYEYDTYGRTIKVTNNIGLTDEFTYDEYGNVASKKDYRGNITTYVYDAFGRNVSTLHPDNTEETTQYVWSTEGTNGLFAIKRSKTGKPAIYTVYDALSREVRKGDKRFNGQIRKIDKTYDIYGNLTNISLPYTGSNPSKWNTMSYDAYDRVTSITEASGRKTTYAYAKNTITECSDNITKRKCYDSQGKLVSLSDPVGTIVYNYAADGKPTSIVAPGNVSTSFEYDKYRRRAALNDPSSGRTTYEYDDNGNLTREINANGQTMSYTYDNFDRLIQTTLPEFTISYTYNTFNEISDISSSNGTLKTFSYDNFGRIVTQKETVLDNKWLQQSYTYDSGNKISTTYSSHSGTLATENYIYTNGHMSEIRLNGSTSIYRLSSENTLGQATQIYTGGIARNYVYTDCGLLSEIKAYGSFCVMRHKRTPDAYGLCRRFKTLSSQIEHCKVSIGQIA